MKRILFTLALAATTLAASAQKTVNVESTADETVKWWDNSTAPHSNEETEDERFDEANHLEHISETVFYIFKADPAKASKRSVVIVPGGGYRKLCMSKGLAFAEQLRDNGYTVMVVKYRLPNLGHKEVPIEDAQAALKYMRDNAERLGIDPAKVGICGGSAGGHLAAVISNILPDDEKPEFSVLIYPVISGEIWSNIGQFNTIRQFLGKDRTPVDVEKHSVENMVGATTPPTFLLLSDDDFTAPVLNSTIYYKALKRHGVKATMHIYPSGGHGWIGKKGFKYTADYCAMLTDWLAGLDENDRQ